MDTDGLPNAPGARDLLSRDGIVDSLAVHTEELSHLVHGEHLGWGRTLRGIECRWGGH